jgi:hypothetical protein
MEARMNALTKALLVGASALTLTATSVSAAIVCNDEGDCWHVRGQPTFKPELRLQIHPDNWRWSGSEHYRWREHEGHGYWHGGAWVEVK